MGKLARKAIYLMELCKEEFGQKEIISSQVDVAHHSHSDYERGNCETCRASGRWPGHGEEGELWCFHYAVFLGKAGRPSLITDRVREKCPRGKGESKCR